MTEKEGEEMVRGGRIYSNWENHGIGELKPDDATFDLGLNERSSFSEAHLPTHTFYV